MSSSAERFIEKLAEQEVLPEAVIKRLWDKVADSSSVPPARALAQFLIDKGHLTREQADAALGASKPQRRPKPPPEPEKAVSTEAISSSGEDPDEALEEAVRGRDPKDAKRKKAKKKYVKKARGESEFDTPLMLLGGGGLVILVLCVVGITWLLFSESGDERLQAARAAFEAGSYTQAIQDYERFLEKFSRHEGRSTARVTLGIARIRQAPESNPEKRLEVAKREIRAIEEEEEFPDAQEDLASLLPGIAKGLSEKADSAEDLDTIEKFVKLTEEALVLCANTKYLPSRLRDEQEIDRIEQLLARIGQRQEALVALGDTLAAMQRAVDAGDTRSAYAAHSQFVKAHPEKAGDDKLLAAVAATSQAEQAGVRFIEEPIAALTSDAKSAVKAAVAMADRRRPAEAPADGVTVVRFQGGAYAFDRRNGRLLWRRPVGATVARVEPVLIDDDCLLVNSTRKEVVRVDAETNKLKWRISLDDAIAQPVLHGDRVFVAGESGKLHVLDATSGNRLGYVRFAQPLRSSPAVYSDGGRIFLVGEHSSLYTLDAKDLSCLGVYYLGHAAGAVVSPPAVVLNRLLVVENDGATTSRLHVLALDEKGAVQKRLNPEEAEGSRLPGLVTRPPEVFGKRFAVLTESGHIGVYEASAESDSAGVILLATRAARPGQRSTQFAAVADQQLWVASTGLSRYSIQPSGNRLPIREVEEPFRGDVFVHPLNLTDNIVIHVRRRRGRAGVTVAASDLRTGKVYWETDIAAPAAGAPVSAVDAAGVLFATARGNVYLIDDAAIQVGVSEQVVGDRQDSDSAHFDAGASTAGVGLFGSTRSGSAISVVKEQGRPAVRQLKLAGSLATRPIRFAEGWLAASDVGQVLYFNGETGEPLAAPFQPELSPRESLNWLPASVTEIDGKQVAFLSDGRTNLYALQSINIAPAPILSVRSQHTLTESRFASRTAVVGDHVAVATADGKLRFYSTSTLEALGEAPPTADIVWGPFAAGDRVVAATADDRLLGIRPEAPEEELWSVRIDKSSLASSPQEDDGHLLLPLHDGGLELRRIDDGEIVARGELGQAISAIYHGSGANLLAAATDGTLLLVEPPRVR